MLVLTDVTWSSDNTGGHISWSRLFQWSEMCWWWCLCLFSRVQSSQKHHLLTVIVSTPWRDIQSHHGSRTSSLMTATQNSSLMRQNTPCLVCTACFTFFFSFWCVQPYLVVLHALVWHVLVRFPSAAPCLSLSRLCWAQQEDICQQLPVSSGQWLCCLHQPKHGAKQCELSHQETVQESKCVFCCWAEM